MKKILIGGSPCTHWSIAQAAANREVQPEGLGWELFLNYLIAKEKFKPDFFLYENNKSVSQVIKEQISMRLGVELMHINSALVSAQNRERFYAFNWDAQQPEDKKILLRDILEDSESLVVKPIQVDKNGKSRPIQASYGKYAASDSFKKTNPRSGVAIKVENPVNTERTYEVRDNFITFRGKQYLFYAPDGTYTIRKLTPTEVERLQTMPDGYTKAVCNTQRYRCLGNGWTAEVITHILREGLKNVPRDEELVVLSMYDGIATGRYCLEQLGFQNVKYYAYEIDKAAITVALDNFPDIIQCGDAFRVRDDDWKIEEEMNSAEDI